MASIYEEYRIDRPNPRRETGLNPARVQGDSGASDSTSKQADWPNWLRRLTTNQEICRFESCVGHQNFFGPLFFFIR